MALRRLFLSAVVLCGSLAPAYADEEPDKVRVPETVTFRFLGEVNDEAEAALTAAADYALHGAKTFRVLLDTPGGDVDNMLSISRRLELLASAMRVECVVDGQAASAGFYILQACQHRYMTQRSVLMAHEAAFGQLGGVNINRLDQAKRWLSAIIWRYSAHCAARMKITTGQFLAKIRGVDWWIMPAEAMAVGAVDEVLPSPNAAL